jgi:hypothetical protein
LRNRLIARVIITAVNAISAATSGHSSGSPAPRSITPRIRRRKWVSGRTSPHRRNLIEGPGDYGYPYAIQADDGKIHLIFTSDRRTGIYHAVFEEADLVKK